MSNRETGPPASEQLLTVDQQLRQGAVVLSARGEIDQMTAARFRASLDAALDAAAGSVPARRVVINLLEVSFLGSVGLTALANAAERASALDEPLRIVVDHNRPVVRPIQMSGLDNILPLAYTVEEALTS